MHFLHIADAHFGYETMKGSKIANSAIRHNYMEGLTETICNININKRLDFILFTGDIVWSASSEEYSEAASWLMDLIERCGLTSKDLFICPGNHDIDRGEIEDVQFPDSQKAADYFLQVEKMSKLQRRFSSYINFCNDMKLSQYRLGSLENYLIGYRDIGKYRIVCINTAWCAKCDDVKDKMWIGSGFVEILKEELKENNKLTITIMHHPSYCWHEEERSNYSETTNVYKEVCMFSDMVLTGHCHETSSTLEYKYNAVISSTGALFQGRNYANCFYTYEIDCENKDNQIRVRHFWDNNNWRKEAEKFCLQQDWKFEHIEKHHTTTNFIKKCNHNSVYSTMMLQSNLYCIAGQIIKYVPIVGSWYKDNNEYYYGDFNIYVRDNLYQLPQEILNSFYENSIALEDINNIENNVYEEKVRFDGFKVQINGGERPHCFNLQFSKTTYRDFLIVKSIIDKKVDSCDTIRTKYLSEKNSLISNELPNICGVGIFIITSDEKLIISESSSYVAVNPEKYIYSASGTMNWDGDNTNPFHDVMRECKEEIGYEPNIENLRLYSIGMDYETAYYQFSFYEYSNKTAREIIEGANMARDFNIEIQRIIPVDFKCSAVMDILNRNNRWDETAKANLFTLAAKEFGLEAIKKYIDPILHKENYRRNMIRMWNMRAERKGRLPVLSSRYPVQRLKRKSDEYIDAVIGFIDEDLSDKSILELGGGIGLFTKYFAECAKTVTSVDVCEKMIEKNRSYLGDKLIQKVDYENCFFQDYETEKHFDILICSLVLIHNEPELDEIVQKMKSLSDVIYLFEHTDQGVQVSMHTHLKTANEYISMFPEYDIIKKSSHMLCQDEISFIKFQRSV